MPVLWRKDHRLFVEPCGLREEMFMRSFVRQFRTCLQADKQVISRILQRWHERDYEMNDLEAICKRW